MLNTVLFTHTDLDGIGCGLIFQKFYEDRFDVKVCHCNYNDIDDVVIETISSDDVGPRTDIMFTDICCSEKLLAELAAAASSNHAVYVFDHHPTAKYAEKILGDNAYIIPEKDGIALCGTSILYNYLCSEFEIAKDNTLMAQFVQDVQDYDTFAFKNNGNEEAKYLNILLWMIGTEKFKAIMHERISLPSDEALISDAELMFVQAKIEQETSYIASLTDDSFMYYIWKGLKVAIMINCQYNIGEICVQYSKRNASIDIYCAIVCTNKGIKYELRTARDDINLGTDFAKPMGGGGHPKAAGFSMDTTKANTIISSMIKYIN